MDNDPLITGSVAVKKERKKIQKLKNKAQTEKRKEKKPPAGRCRSIRIYPTPDQRSILKKWMGAVRWTYNECVRLVSIDKKVQNNLKELRAAVVNLDSSAVLQHEWLKEVPYDVRDEGVRDYIKAVEINKMKGERFDMKFRSKKDPSDTIVAHAKHWKDSTLKFGVWKGSKLKSAEPLPDILSYDSRIQRMRTGEYFMRMPMAAVVRDESQVPSHCCAIDPGVRTFMTCYDPFSERLIEFGAKDMSRIFRLARTSDSLISKMAKANARKRYSYRRAMLRNNQKIRYLVQDMHRKSAKFLCENFRVIMLPQFESQKMVSRQRNRKIRSKTARAMITWSHYRFRQHLLFKMSEYPNRIVLSVSEEYTSKTCGVCGNLHHKLGGNKTFRCPSCFYETDRDWNAARNIYLKNMSLLFTGEALGPTPFRT